MVGSDKKLLKNTDGITLLFHRVLKMEKLQLNKRFFLEFFSPFIDHKPYSGQPIFIHKNSQNCTFSDFSALCSLQQ